MIPHAPLSGTCHESVNVFAGKAFPICAAKLTSGTIVNYYEVTRTLTLTPGACNTSFRVGFSTGPFPEDSLALRDTCANFDAIQQKVNPGQQWLFQGKDLNPGHFFEWFSGGISQEWNRPGDSTVVGCGIFLNSKNELVIFFTSNGTLLDKQIPFKRQQQQQAEKEDLLLYPTSSYWRDLETNFGIDSTKPFKYDIENLD